MKFLFFTLYFPPDLSAGSFRAKALVEALQLKIEPSDEIHVITTKSSRYKSYKVNSKSYEESKNIKIHRIDIPNHQGGTVSQAFFYLFYATKALRICKNIKADFLIGTSSRLMTGLLTSIASILFKAPYYLDIRDIFSESFSDVFLSKNRFLRKAIQKTIIHIERFVLSRASKVSINSESFRDYFSQQNINTENWSFHPNGVDPEFLSLETPNLKQKEGKEINVLYAGNIGFAQSLSSLIPSAAVKLEGKFFFHIIGDGTDKKMLMSRIKSEKIKNISVSEPVSRSELIKIYQKADILMINLQKLPAFDRVLPSKIFEYSAIGKPIIAGLSGYSKTFLKENVAHAIFFKPNDSIDFINALDRSRDTHISPENITSFCDKFSRKKIMTQMSEEIISTAHYSK